MNRVFCAGLLAAAFIAPILQLFASEISQASDAMPSVLPSGERKLDPGILERYARLPLAFEENHGQAPADTRFIARGPGYQVHLSSSAIAVRLVGRGQHDGADQFPIVRMRFLGARSDAGATGVDRLVATTNYFRGPDAAQPLTDIPNYSRVQFDEVYPGIGIVYYGNQRQLEYDLVLQPGADPNMVRLAFDGADHLTVDQDGNLQLAVDSETVQLQHPLVYQEYDGRRHPVAASFQHFGHNEIAIRTAAYDHKHALTIDPVLSYSTFLGGSGGDFASAIAVDGAGNAYLAGYTASSNFPLVSAYDTRLGKGTTEAFVSKLNAAGTALIYSTYLGGQSGYSYATGVAIDSSGNAYVTGTTTGSDFPVTTGAYQKGVTAGGSFAAKLGATGKTLTYSTYILNATATSIAVDGSGSAYITGNAKAGFATTSSALQTAIGSSTGTNAFVLRLNATGTGAAYSTFLGGNGTDSGAGIAVDANGNAYIGGATTSTNFPLAHAFQSTPRGQPTGFVTKLGPNGNALVYSTYLGGSLIDRINGIAIDASGSAYVAGETYSSDFPITAGAYVTGKPGYFLMNSVAGGGFVTKLRPAGDNLVYSTFLGGGYCVSWCSLFSPPPTTPGDAAYAIAVDNAGHAYVTGIARSPDFPLVDALPPNNERKLGKSR